MKYKLVVDERDHKRYEFVKPHFLKTDCDNFIEFKVVDFSTSISVLIPYDVLINVYFFTICREHVNYLNIRKSCETEIIKLFNLRNEDFVKIAIDNNNINNNINKIGVHTFYANKSVMDRLDPYYRWSLLGKNPNED